VVFALLILLVVANQGFWTWRLRRGDQGVRFYALYAAGLYLVFALIGLLGTIQLVKYTCDESCYGPGWIHAREAWQWEALPALAAAWLAAAAASTLSLAVRWYRASLAALGVSIAVLTPYGVLLTAWG
jgi:hypothetical protein